MPPPLSDAVVATLKADPCAALAAIMVIANAHGELMAWALRSLGALEAASENKAALAAPKPNGCGKSRRAGGKLDVAAYQARRRSQRDADDERLIETMKEAPEASIKEWGTAIGKCRTATVHALHRLRAAGLVENEDGAWALVKPSTPGQPAASASPWIAPLSGARVARHAADGRVRHELTMAPSPAS
jgi:hypothetical protein